MDLETLQQACYMRVSGGKAHEDFIGLKKLSMVGNSQLQKEFVIGTKVSSTMKGM